jgi:hypothetical protein
MALYRIAASIGSKAEGHSAGQKCAYISRTENYAKKADECAYTASGNMPKWPKTNPQQDPAHYWKAADTYEPVNGRLYRELQFALPRELNLDQQKALCHAFAEKATTLADGGKLPFTFAIHIDPENHNPHCHLMLSERANDGINRNASTWFKRANLKDPKKGGAFKSQELNGPKWLNPIREALADMTNEALKEAGSTAKVDHRSYEAQGLDIIPCIHMGAAKSAMLKRGAPCRLGEEIQHLNKQAAAANTLRRRYPQPKSPVARLAWKGIRAKGVAISKPNKDGSPKTAKQIMDDIMRSWSAVIQSMIETERIEMETARIKAEAGLESLPDPKGFRPSSSMGAKLLSSPAPTGMGSHFGVPPKRPIPRRF